MKKRKPLAAERIGAIADKWFIREPAFLLALTSHETRPNPRIRTIRSGMGVIEYNPGYIDSLPDEALEKALTSECVRILLRHPYRFPPNNAAISYRASNITINEWYEGWICRTRRRISGVIGTTRGRTLNFITGN